MNTNEMKIKEQLQELVSPNWNLDIDGLARVIARHQSYFVDDDGRPSWKHGKPFAIFWRDGLPSVEYADREWWHYKIRECQWY